MVSAVLPCCPVSPLSSQLLAVAEAVLRRRDLKLRIGRERLDDAVPRAARDGDGNAPDGHRLNAGMSVGSEHGRERIGESAACQSTKPVNLVTLR